MVQALPTSATLEHSLVDGVSVAVTARALWAKLRFDEHGAVVAWHSLVHHSADVAAVLLALLAQPTIAARMERLTGRPLCTITVSHLGALAFLHDIGKANRGFRARVDPRAERIGYIDQVAWLFRSTDANDLCSRLCDVLGLDRIEPWFPDEAAVLLDAVFAHHGRPYSLDAGSHRRLWELQPGSNPIAELAPMRDALDRWFPRAFQPGPALPKAPAFVHAFAGMLMLADWLGSDSGDAFFPFANGAGPDRMAFAAERAEEAIRTVGLSSAPREVREAAAQVDFAAAFDVAEPRPVQKVIVRSGAACLVLEAETGSGKTEAALWRFRHLFTQGAVDGMYFALPTRVAATAMFARIKAFRDRVFRGAAPPAIVLAVPGQVAVDGAEGRSLPGFGFEWDDAPPGTRSGARWTVEHPKRFLAATIAVGTVDQALLGAVRVKHAHLRGAALMRHLLVVDEVHASDRYMEELLTTLLSNHLGAGGHALLLSATLGAAARARLLGTPCPDPIEAEAVPYPALSWNEAGAEKREVPEETGSGQRTGKQVAVATTPLLDHPDRIAQLAFDAAKAGAKVLVMRNTVAAAVATAQALEALAGPSHPALFRVRGVATVHHGRFAATDRRALDAAVEAALGKVRARGGTVVVGTQTLEVSLDLDADLLVTDFCPADVLLQRIGRLHRHRDLGRVRPKGFETPGTIVLVPAGRDLVPFAKRGGGRHGLGRVYDDLCMIEATWRQIEAHPTWSIPADNRRLVERTTHPALLGAIEAELVARNPAWVPHVEGKQGKTLAEQGTAKYAGLDWNTPFECFRLDQDEHVTTRLGTADRQVELPDAPEKPFGLSIATLRVPHFLLNGVAEDENAEEVTADAGVIRFRLGASKFRYDRFGLRSER